MSERTKEPWCVMGPCAQWETARIFSGARYIGSIGNSDETESETRANADRIVSCVNACAGMEAPDEYISSLKARCDELLEAAKDMLADLDSFDGPEKFIDGEYPHFSPCGRMLDMKHAARFRAAIANAEKGKPEC